MRIVENDTVKNVKILGLEESIIASGYPMATDVEDVWNADVNNSLSRAQKLSNVDIGTGHDQFLTGIVVQFDLTFTIKAWTEMQRYHFMDFVSSQSTMHRITKMDLDKVYNEHVDKRIVKIMKEKVAAYNDEQDAETKKQLFLDIVYSNPCGCKLTARMTTNYRQLKTIYQQRKNHRLPEWRSFCEWIETLPKADFIIGKESVTEEKEHKSAAEIGVVVKQLH